MSEIALALEDRGTKTAATFWVGIDVAKADFEAAIHPPLQPGARPDLASLAVKSFARTCGGVKKLLAWIDDALAESALDEVLFEPRVRAIMEATGKYSLELTAWLLAARPALSPSIVNPGFIAAHGRSLGARNKTDRTDARVIARFGAERSPEPHQPLTPEQAQLRELTRERQSVIADRVALAQRAAQGSVSTLVRKMRKKTIAHLEKQQAHLEEAIEEILHKTPAFKADIERLSSIPGIGLVTAATVLAELGDLRAFQRARALSAFVGLSPRQHRSGSSINRRTRMSKKGNPRVRAALYMATLSAIRRDNALGRYYRRMVARGKPKMAAVGAVMRKLLVLMRALLISNSTYDDALALSGKLGHNPVNKLTSSCVI